MEQRKRFGAMVAISLLSLLPFSLKAQISEQDRSYAVQVQGLTADDRDALQLALEGRSHLRLVFACVPAGILVFEPVSGESKQQARQHALHLLETKALQSRAADLQGGRTEAEAACAHARNR